ncbi:MAG: EAL domain-containing protein, partial [Gammaproteobacteria bacterium]|nr:EAL domain-containing protein [Gammaproteobacteria bacterium]
DNTGDRITGRPEKFMTIERKLQMMLVITLIFGVASVFTIVHISKGTRYHQLNSGFITTVDGLTLLLNRPESHPPSLGQVRDVLYELVTQEEKCLSMTNRLDRLVMKMIGTHETLDLCRQNLAETIKHLDWLDEQIAKMPNLTLLDEATRDHLAYLPDRLLENTEKFDELTSQAIGMTVTAALWFILPFSLLVFLISYTIIRGVTRNAIEYRETAEALAESEIQNRKLAYYDSLTQLPNRNLLSDRLDQAILTANRHKSEFALLFLDLDRFKHINDTLGHSAGDALIKQAATRIKRCLRASDTLARFGGDEFVIILPELRADVDVSVIAEKIIRQISEPYHLEGVDTYVTASLGIAIFPDNGEDRSTLMKRADIAMYQAKGNGKNQFSFYNNEINSISDKRLILERDLRYGLDNDELMLHYQPVIDLKSGRIAGVEALLRWHHGQQGLVLPSEFIPIAEDTGLIVDIGYRIIEMACQQCSVWRKLYSPDIHVAVNVSARQLREPDLVSHINTSLEKYSLSPDALDIEITESALYSNNERCINTLRELAGNNLRLLLDDFGTGYSSLSTLRSLPFDIIKIDRSFIDISQDKNRKITESILDIAENFEMQVVAEGIEHSSVASFLKQRGCKYGQGYLFKKPVPASELDFSENFSRLIEVSSTLKVAGS